MRTLTLAVPVALGAIALSACGDDDEKSSESPKAPAPSASKGASGSTPSGQRASFAVRVAPARAGKPARVGYSLSISTRTGAKPAAAQQITFKAQRGFKLNADAFPSCSLADLKARGEKPCAKARVGDGSAQVVTPKGKRLTSRISAFSGGAQGKRTTFLYYIQTPGYDPIAAAATVARQASGKWGYSITYPPISDALPLTRLTLRTFDLTAQRNGRPVHLIETPGSCPGSWKFGSQIAFRSGEKLNLSSTVACS